MKNIILIAAIFAFFGLNEMVGQCNSTSDDLSMMTIKGNPSGQITVTANSALTYEVGLFGTLLLEVPMSTTGASINGASAVGLTFGQFFNSQDLGLPPGKKYAYFTSSTTINPMTLFPNGIDVEVGTISVVPAANLATSSIVLTDLLPPVNNGGTFLFYKTAVQVCNTNGFNDNLIGDAPNAALPIELERFEATAREKDIMLDWEASEEINLAGYEILRSLDTKNFDKIGFVSYNKSKKGSYTHIDKDVEFNTHYYYILRAVDLDDRYEDSEIRKASIVRDFISDFAVYPNPSKGHLYVNASKIEESDIEVFNLNGVSVLSHISIHPEGADTYYLDCEDLKTGTYIVRIKDKTRKVVIFE